MDIYSLSRNFWDYAYDNPEFIKPNHCALYFFCVEHCNRLGWKEKFALPSSMAMEAIGIKSHNTYIKTLNDLVEIGLIKMIQKSKNQYSANFIALSKFNKAHSKALDKALLKHDTKQRESKVQSTVQSIDSIDIPINKFTNLQIYNSTIGEMVSPYANLLNDELENFISYWGEKDLKGKERWQFQKFFDVKRRISTWMKNKENFAPKESFKNGNSVPQKGKIQKNFENIGQAHKEIQNDIANGNFINPLDQYQ